MTTCIHILVWFAILLIWNLSFSRIKLLSDITSAYEDNANFRLLPCKSYKFTIYIVKFFFMRIIRIASVIGAANESWVPIIQKKFIYLINCIRYFSLIWDFRVVGLKKVNSAQRIWAVLYFHLLGTCLLVYLLTVNNFISIKSIFIVFVIQLNLDDTN